MAIKDASHVFGWANMWNPLNGLRPLELFGSSHVFASVSGKLNRMDVTGEKLSSARRHIWGSQEKLPNGPILNAFFFFPPKCFNSLMDGSAANSPSTWRDDAGLANMQTWHRKGPGYQGIWTPSFLQGHSANHHATCIQTTRNEKKYWLEDATRQIYCLICHSLLKKRKN